MFNQWLLWPFLFVIPALFFRNKGFYNSESFWTNITLVSLLSANFMSKQYNAYSPMCIDMRHYLYLIPMVAVASSPYIVRLFFAARVHWKKVILLICAAMIYFVQVKSLSSYAFTITVGGIIFLVILRAAIIHPTIRLSWFLWSIFLLLWFSFPISQMIKNSSNPFHYIKPFIFKHFGHQNQAIVLTDPILKRIADYYMSWDSSRVRFVNERLPDIPYREEAASYFVFHNGLTWWFLEKKQPESMLLWYLREPYIQLIDSTHGNYLYSVTMPDSIHRPTDTLEFFCDMEMFDQHFTPTLLDDKLFYSRKHSNLLKEQGFSTTFFKEMSDWHSSKTSKVEIEFGAMIWLKNKSKVKMVVSLVDSIGKNYFWLGKDVQDLLEPKAIWQNVLFKASYKPANYPHKIALKIYLWNDDTLQVWVDNIRIRIIKIEHL